MGTTNSAISIKYLISWCSLPIYLYSISSQAQQIDLTASETSQGLLSRSDQDGLSVKNCLPVDIATACQTSKPMRSLTPEEVELIMGANYGTSLPPVTVTGNPPSWLPSSPPPSNGGGGDGGGGDGGGGDGGSSSYPSTQEQSHLINCAKAYGSVSPLYTTNFTHNYAWVSYSTTTGLPIAHVVKPTETAPGKDPPGGGNWFMVEATTYYMDSPKHTDMYMLAYTQDKYTVRDLVHEWYHQNHDVVGESVETFRANEANAKAAGEAAEQAYVSDNGAKCAGK
jgi:hypothetical protein